MHLRTEHTSLPLPSKNLQSGLNDRIGDKPQMEAEAEAEFLQPSDPGGSEQGLQVMDAPCAGSDSVFTVVPMETAQQSLFRNGN